MLDVIGFIGVTIAAFVVGTFAEYFVHRAMHWRLISQFHGAEASVTPASPFQMP